MPDYESVLVEYFKQIDAGVQVDPEEIVRANPEHESRLRRFFGNVDGLNQLLGDLSGIQPSVPEDDAAALDQTLGEFRIRREIGRGGMGVVYEAEQISMGRPVALKVLHAGAALDPEKVARFQNEVRAVSQLNHEHIVPVHAIGQHQGTHYFAMKLIDGTTLTEVMRAH
jgi:serine/threonine protein kinase